MLQRPFNSSTIARATFFVTLALSTPSLAVEPNYEQKCKDDRYSWLDRLIFRIESGSKKSLIERRCEQEIFVTNIDTAIDQKYFDTPHEDSNFRYQTNLPNSSKDNETRMEAIVFDPKINLHQETSIPPKTGIMPSLPGYQSITDKIEN